MSALVSSWSKNVHTLPENFVCSSEERPGDLAVPLCRGIPVVDLQQVDGHDRADSIKQIMKGSQDFGMFQVINHGLLKELMDDTMSLFKEFFDMPEEDKATYYSEDTSKSFRLYTGSFPHSVINHNYWKDSRITLKLGQKSQIDTEVVGTYSVEVRKLGLRILNLICEGLGIEVGYFAGDLSKFQGMIVNHYPPCPNPSVVLGVCGHYDTNLLTLLQQDEYGLHILKDGQWVGVKHVPGAFVINIGSQLESRVHHALNPNPYSGVFGSDREKYARDVEDLISFRTSGHVVGFISEAIQGVGGIIEVALGYFLSVYSSIKKAGGLRIADEVQSGFAHTGSHFWGFETQGIVPDIVTMAKVNLYNMAG
ncbi:hypothetical protein HYC85_009326 [Camellia sinensis]|uniref:Fe2OG dioxygenase domain-containing protein n=1 Tax=Camellia sinensis TaxID=4442 RepID=A0A7J7HEN3_CAMSI|nr:hypothetical protein HYC85_009326 [Camellia sinensis]